MSPPVAVGYLAKSVGCLLMEHFSVQLLNVMGDLGKCSPVPKKSINKNSTTESMYANS